MVRLLVIDDEASICWSLQELGRELGWQVAVAASAEAGLEACRQQVPDVIMLDVRLPGMDGLSALTRIREIAGAVPVIVMTAYGSMDIAVRAARSDAIEYLLKPFDLPTAKAAVLRAAQSQVALPGPRQESNGPNASFAGNSPAMQAVYRRIALSSLTAIPVLLTGESGTGKELAAREIHRHSQFAGGPFVAINIAALNPTLAESELFGHVRGAFTGADQARTGLLVQANGGTLFLDEVAEIPLAIQVKLLRALEQGEVLPVGASQTVPTRFRIISASHRDLVENIERGNFRHDLYFRLAGFRIDMPNLRSRPDDILELARFFLARARPAADPQREDFSADARQELVSRNWPGNVRELRSAVEHAVVMARGGTIEACHLPAPLPAIHPGGAHPAADRPAPVGTAIRQWFDSRSGAPEAAGRMHAELMEIVERPLIEAALEQSRGQVAAAARLLGLHRTTLKKRIEELGLGSADEAG